MNDENGFDVNGRTTQGFDEYGTEVQDSREPSLAVEPAYVIVWGYGRWSR